MLKLVVSVIGAILLGELIEKAQDSRTHSRTRFLSLVLVSLIYIAVILLLIYYSLAARTEGPIKRIIALAFSVILLVFLVKTIKNYKKTKKS